MKTSPEPIERAKLRQFIMDRFSLGELKDVTFDLGVNYEQLAHNTIGDLARELIAHFERRDQLSCLVAEIVKRRPDSDLAQLLAKLSPCETNTAQVGETIGNGPSILSTISSRQLPLDANEQLEAKRNELLIARRVLLKQQEDSETPGHKIVEQQKYIRELEREIHVLEEKLQAAG